jgi:hypothetical protein
MVQRVCTSFNLRTLGVFHGNSYGETLTVCILIPGTFLIRYSVGSRVMLCVPPTVENEP